MSDISKRIKSYFETFGDIAFNNRMILKDRFRKVERGRVNLHWYSIRAVYKELKLWYDSGALENAGDYLSVVVTDWAKQYHGISETNKKTKHLYSIGSIINGGFQNATIWGSGLISGKNVKFGWSKFRKLDIRAVRGPVTREAMLFNGYKCPEIYGDPAILLPRIYMPTCEKEYDVSVIRHYVDSAETELHTIDILIKPDEWKGFIDEICKSELIVSSSLHGIILAESYGIPAILLGNDKLDLFKYRDWYSSTVRNDFPIANSIEEALSMTPPPIPDLESMRDKLMDVFPTDIYQ